MPKFFQTEIGAHGGEKQGFQNVKFKKRDFNNSSAARSGTILEIIPVHIKNPPVIQFLAYLGRITDRFGVSFQASQPFGRPDPYQIWKGNSRTIRLSVDLPSSSVAKGLDNLNNLSWFLAALYPTYRSKLTATSVSATPMFRVRYGNLISSMTSGGQGILCVIKGVAVTHDLKQGVIGAIASGMRMSGGTTAGQLIKAAGFDNYVRDGEKILIPKSIKLGFSLTVVHDHSLGWDHDTGKWRGAKEGAGYPYKFGLVRDTKDELSLDPVGDLYSDTSIPEGAAPPSPGSPEAQQTNASQTIISDTDEDVGVEESWWDTATSIASKVSFISDEPMDTAGTGI